MTGLEKKIVSSSIKSRYAVLNAKGTAGYVQASDGNKQYFYVFSRAEHSVIITDILDYVLDEDAIEQVRRRTHDGAAQSGERSDRKTGQNGIGQRFGLHNAFATEEARQSKGNVAVFGNESGGDRRRNYGESIRNYSNGGADLTSSERSEQIDGELGDVARFSALFTAKETDTATSTNP